ncbi:MAG: hypothetical protein ALAOOOJD_04452 [bacterium]|nr:hypothetical protein [bacterium]
MKNTVASFGKLFFAERREALQQIRAAGGRGETGGTQRRALRGRAVTIAALNFNRIVKLAIQLAVAVIILLEMAIGAVHALLGVNVFQMHGLLRVAAGFIFHRLVPVLKRHDAMKLVRRLRRNDFAVLVQQIALAILFKHRAENPAVAVIIRKLRAFELGIELRHGAQEIRIIPIAAQDCFFRIGIQLFKRCRG